MKALNVLVAKADTSKMALIAKAAIVIQVEVMEEIVAPMANAIADLGLKENVVMTVLLVMLALNVTDVLQGILDILIAKVSLKIFALCIESH